MKGDKMKVYDATTIKSYLRCPRHYYFRMYKHWTSDRPKPPLVFGLAMHKALEEIYHDVSKATPQIALQAFATEWVKHGLDPEEFHPRSIQRAKQILDGYFTGWKDKDGWHEGFAEEIKQTVVHGVEVPFTLELSDEVMYGGRLDAVVELPWVNGAVVLEHKTSSSFRSSWTSGFNPDTQIFGYAAGVRSFFPDARGQVIVNGLLVQKTNLGFLRVPCFPSESTLEAWRWEIADAIEDIKFDIERFDKLGIGFRKNPEACTMWGACEYLDLCQAKSTAIEWKDEECPHGYKVEEWDYTLKMEEARTCQRQVISK